MKKMFKVIATIAAIISMANFVACKSDDDDSTDSGSSDTSETLDLSGTYWILEDETETEGNVTTKTSDASYIYIKDGSSGTLSQIEDWEFVISESNTYTSTNYVDTAFTYTVADSVITITAGEDTSTATLSEDKKSVTLKTTDEDGKEVTQIYNKADAAPTQVTVVVTVTSSSTDTEETTTIDATWDFSVTALTSAGLSTTAAKPTVAKEIPVASGSGATLTVLVQTGASLKIQNATDGGLNIGAGSKETEVLSITVDDTCTLTFTGKGSSGSSWTSAKPNSFSIDGTSIYSKTDVSDTSVKTWTYPITAAGTYKIAASGMIFTGLSCK